MRRRIARVVGVALHDLGLELSRALPRRSRWHRWLVLPMLRTGMRLRLS